VKAFLWSVSHMSGARSIADTLSDPGSGKTSSVHFRLAANRRARQALHVFADNSRHSSPWAAKLYADARARGKRHP
jgi:hypothetical protein